MKVLRSLTPEAGRGGRSNAPGGRPRMLGGCFARVHSERGIALVAVMAIIAAVLLVGMAIFILGHAEGDIVEYGVDDSRAFYIAEGGLERARAYLAALEEESSYTDPVGMVFVGELGGGTYTAKVLADVSGGSWLHAYDVLSTGTKDGVMRTVKAAVIAETYAIYQSFTGSVGAGDSWFLTGERFEGPVHLNGDITVKGDPWFGGYVKAAGQENFAPGSNPTFVRGYETGVDKIDLPDRNYVRATLRAAAQDAAAGGCFFPSIGNKAYYRVELGQPAPGWLSYQPFDKTGTAIVDTLGYIDLAATNGAVWFESDIRISGVLDGQVTIGADGNIEIWDDVIYEGSTASGVPLPNCDDVLGLVAAGASDGNIVIRDVPANHDGVIIHGVLMALQSRLEAENYQHLGFIDYVTLYGGLVQYSHEHLCSETQGNISGGYLRNFHYDYRNLTLPPPFFPYAHNYSVLTWEEVVPPVQVS